MSAMKARIAGVIILLLGLLLLLTPWLIFPVCGVGRNAAGVSRALGHHGCHGTLWAETAIGSATIIIGLLPLIWPKPRVLRPAAWASAGCALLAVLFPLFITGMCNFSTMPCRLATLPAIETVAAFQVISASFILLTFRKTS
jgi:hypothetical protein